MKSFQESCDVYSFGRTELRQPIESLERFRPCSFHTPWFEQAVHTLRRLERRSLSVDEQQQLGSKVDIQKGRRGKVDLPIPEQALKLSRSSDAIVILDSPPGLASAEARTNER
jgi:hypothetical protein